MGQDSGAQLTEFNKKLLGLPYDEELLLDEIESGNLGSGASGTSGRVDTPRAFGPEGPAGDAPFEPLSFAGPAALILPLDADGFVGAAASAFMRGYKRAAELSGGSQAVDIYSTDGRPVSEVAAYRQAVSDGSGSILGPMLRSVANEISALPPAEQVPTLMLQQPDDPATASHKLFFYPLGSEGEVVQFVRTVAAAALRTVVLVEPSAYGVRLARALRSEWGQRSSLSLLERRIGTDDAWRELHGELRKMIQQDIEPAIFVAGNAAFASRARVNIPSALQIHVLASSYAGADQRASERLVAHDGVRFFEMPWLIDPTGEAAEAYADPDVRKLAPNLQRFYAAGVDAYSLVSNFPSWASTNYWISEGVSGTVELQNRRFLRSGLLVEVRNGVVVPVAEG